MERLAGRIILLWGWRRLAAASAAGALLVLTQAPYDFFAAGFVSFPVLVWLIDGATAEASSNPLRRLKPAFATGWWFGFGYFLAGLWWIGGAVLVEADSFAWALPFAVLGIPMLLAFFYGFATAVARLFWANGIARIAAIAFGFGLAEWLRSFLFTGFPWNPVGLAAMPTPLLMQSVALTGVTGMNALAVFVFAMPALLAAGRDLRLGFALAVLLVAAHAGYGYIRLGVPPDASGGKLAVAHRAAVDRPVGEVGRQRARPRLPDDDGAVRASARGGQAGAAAHPVAGDVGALLLHRAAGRACRDRRDAAARPDAGHRRRARGGGRQRSRSTTTPSSR